MHIKLIIAETTNDVCKSGLTTRCLKVIMLVKKFIHTGKNMQPAKKPITHSIRRETSISAIVIKA